MIDERRDLNRRRQCNIKIKSNSVETVNAAEPNRERHRTCQACNGHGVKSAMKGHKQLCPFKDCQCTSVWLLYHICTSFSVHSCATRDN